MPHAKLTLSVPRGTWIGDVSAAHPDAVFRVVAVLSADDAGVALVELSAANPVSIIAAVDDRDDVTGFELLRKHDDVAMLHVEMTAPVLLVPALRAGVPLETPFDIRDGEATWEITTTADRLSSLGRRLDEAGVEYELDYVLGVGDDDADGILTDRQAELLVAAAERGYYDTPRRTTLTELAGSMGIAKATCSDVLHRAEGNLVDWFLEGRFPETV